MTTAKWTINMETSRIGYPAARINEKGCLPAWGGDAIISKLMHFNILGNLSSPKMMHCNILGLGYVNQGISIDHSRVGFP
jgi:hypothetical protein